MRNDKKGKELRENLRGWFVRSVRKNVKRKEIAEEREREGGDGSQASQDMVARKIPNVNIFYK